MPEDAEAWARCHRACWREAYGPLVDPERLAAELGQEGSWTARVSERLALPPGPRSWVAVNDSGEVVDLLAALQRSVAAAKKSRGEEVPDEAEEKKTKKSKAS